MALRLITDCTGELVTLDEVKAHLRLSTVGSDEDALLNTYIKAARKQAENITKRSLLRQTWKVTMDDFPDSTAALYIPRSPISSTAADVVITYLDQTSGDSTTLAATAYTVDAESIPARIFPSASNSWPSVFAVRNAISIQYEAGTSSISAVDENVKTWIKLQVGSLYENREAHSPGVAVFNMPSNFVDSLLDDHVVMDISP